MNIFNKKGYHFTSYDNWVKIKKEGLKAYLINDHLALTEIFPGGIKGIWLWKKCPKTLERLYWAIFQFSKKKTPEIVLLEVEYDPDCTLSNGMHINHDMKLGNLEFDDSPESIIVIKDIGPGNIKLLKMWDLLELIK